MLVKSVETNGTVICTLINPVIKFPLKSFTNVYSQKKHLIYMCVNRMECRVSNEFREDRLVVCLQIGNMTTSMA